MWRALAVVLVIAGCNQPLDHKRIAGCVEDLRALAAEAHLLSTIEHPRHFGDQHREFLVQKIHDARKKLAQGVEDIGDEPVRATAAALADQLQKTVEDGGDPYDVEPPLAALQLRLEQ